MRESYEWVKTLVAMYGDSTTIMKGKIVLEQHKAIITPKHPIPRKESWNAKSPSIECAARADGHSFVDDPTPNSLGE